MHADGAGGRAGGSPGAPAAIETHWHWVPSLTVDLHPFRFSRFAENALLPGEDEYQHFYGFAQRW